LIEGLDGVELLADIVEGEAEFVGGGSLREAEDDAGTGDGSSLGGPVALMPQDEDETGISESCGEGADSSPERACERGGV
jgi:hypothetical protein